MNEVESYILKHQGKKRDVLLYFHLMLIEEYSLRPKIAYGIPMYYGIKWILYLNADGKKGVELAFTRGHLLEDESNLLESKNRKMVKSVEFFNIEEIPVKEINTLIKKAITLDQKLNGKNM